jgi:hypothetical protein
MPIGTGAPRGPEGGAGPGKSSPELPAIRIKEDPPELGALNQKQRAFVIAFVEGGNGNATEAALRAGYTGANCGAQGYRLLRVPAIKAAIVAELKTSLVSGAAEAIATLRAIASNPLHREAVRGATAVLDRIGIVPETKVQVEVTIKTDTEKIDDIRRSAMILGITLRDALGTLSREERTRLIAAGAITDAEYEEVKT